MRTEGIPNLPAGCKVVISAIWFKISQSLLDWKVWRGFGVAVVNAFLGGGLGLSIFLFH